MVNSTKKQITMYTPDRQLDPPNDNNEHIVVPSEDLTNSERVGFLNTLVYLRESCDPTQEQQDAILLLQKMYADNLMFL